MRRSLLSIDARMLFSGGIGTYLQNLLMRMPLGELGMEQIDIYVRTQKEAEWVKKYQPKATVKICPHWIYGFKEQFFWLKNLKGGAFWAPHYNIPWDGYEKLVVTLHDGALPLTPHTPFIYHVYARTMYDRIIQKADQLLTVSEFSRHASQEKGRIYQIPMHVTLLGVDPVWFKEEALPRPYPFKYLIYVGNLKPHKNLTRLLKAFETLKTDCKLVCVGSFKNLKSRDEAAERLMRRMSDRVTFLDEVVGEPLRALVKNAEGLILPSTYEGFGLPPLEAMAAGVPVLVSWAGPMPEVCGEPAIYCNPYSVKSLTEGLTELLELQGESRQRRIAEAKDHARKFNWDKTAKKTFEVLKKTVC